MSEGLSKKKCIRAGHRASTTRMVNRTKALLDDEAPDLTIETDVLKQLDGEILEHVDEDSITDETEQSDAFKEEVYTVMIQPSGSR